MLFEYHSSVSHGFGMCRDFRTQLRHTVDPPAHKAVVKFHAGFRTGAHIAKQGFPQFQLIGTQIPVDIPTQHRHHRCKIKTFQLFHFLIVLADFVIHSFPLKIVNKLRTHVRQTMSKTDKPSQTLYYAQFSPNLCSM